MFPNKGMGTGNHPKTPKETLQKKKLNTVLFNSCVRNGVMFLRMTINDLKDR